ncbi:unnamed protein product, partial [Rotaria sp. Silwood1]
SADIFMAKNHRKYARLTARHLSDLRIWPEEILDHLSKSFAVSRSNRNFSSIALDQTIEATINKMGKGHGGITGRCSPDLIDIWSKSYTFRSLLSTITSELAGVESNFNSIESHIECSSSRMLADHVDLQIILDKLVEEKLFSLDTNNVTQLFTGIYSTYFLTTNQQQALVIDGSSLLHIYPRAGSNVFEYAIYLLVEHITPLFIDYSRIDIIFDSSRSQDLKSFIHRHSNKNTTQPKYDRIVRSSLLPTGKKYQNFVASNRAVLATAVIECWKDTEATEKLPLGSVLVLAGPLETAIKLEKDKQPMNMVELESNQIEADSRIIFHIDQLIQNSFFNIVVKSIDTDVIVLCIYYASLLGLKKLVVDATVPKKPPKVIDCTYIHNELIDKFGVNPILLLIVYALSGCDTCSFTRNISKRTFMQTLFDTPNDFADLQKLTTFPVTKDNVRRYIDKVYNHF